MKKQNIAVIGYGKFAQTLEKVLPIIFPGIPIDMAKRDIKRAAMAQSIIPAVPIREFETVIKQLAPLVNESHTIIDVCSVKIHPTQVMKNLLPSSVQILATHPMFGPGTLAKTQGSLQGLKIVIDPVRIKKEDLFTISNALQAQGIEVVPMSSEDHDKYAAQFHFSSQFIASVLKDLSIHKTPIDTASVSVLHEFSEFVQTDSIALLQDMYKYNPYCKRQLEHIQSSVEQIARSIQS